VFKRNFESFVACLDRAGKSLAVFTTVAEVNDLAVPVVKLVESLEVA
jgi:hypothetical protein